MSNKLTYILLSVIVVIAIATRFFKLDKYPPSITWDEAAFGYNAYTILHWGKDEWGETLPLTFKSFGEDKNPVNIYLTVPFVAIFGLNDFSVRAPSALFGVFNVIAIFFLTRMLFRSDAMALISSFFLAISPYNIQFSRFAHELNFAIFLFTAGVYFFYLSLERNQKYFLVSFLSFGICLFTYHSAKILTPPLVVLLIIINWKKIVLDKKIFLYGISIYLFFIGLFVIRPELLGIERFKQNQIPKDQIEKVGLSNILINRYVKYFQKDFLFITGDNNPRHSIQTVGTFYWFELPLLIVGTIGLLYGLFFGENNPNLLFRGKHALFLIVWILLAPIPGAVSSEMPHASRAMFMTVSWTMVSAYGAYLIINFLQNNEGFDRSRFGKIYKIIAIVLLLFFSSASFYKYIKSYYGEYGQKYGIEWIYGMKEIVKFASKNDFYRYYVTDVRMQPYIFFLYYLQVPLPEYLSTVKYNMAQSKSSSLVSGFGKYRFQWDEIQSLPDDAVLYIVSPSIYGGLAYRKDFEVLKLIKYPNGSDAFYIVTKKYQYEEE